MEKECHNFIRIISHNMFICYECWIYLSIDIKIKKESCS